MTAVNHGRLPYCNDFRHGCVREGVETALIDDPFRSELSVGTYHQKSHGYEAYSPTDLSVP